MSSRAEVVDGRDKPGQDENCAWDARPWINRGRNAHGRLSRACAHHIVLPGLVPGIHELLAPQSTRYHRL